MNFNKNCNHSPLIQLQEVNVYWFWQNKDVHHTAKRKDYDMIAKNWNELLVYCIHVLFYVYTLFSETTGIFYSNSEWDENYVSIF